MKKCIRCGVGKKEGDFHRNKVAKDGLFSWCKDCRREYDKEYQRTEKKKEYNKAYKKTDKYKEYNRAYRNTEEYREYQREYNKTEKRKKQKEEYRRVYQKTEKYKESQRKCRNTDEYREHLKKRKATDHKFKLTCNMATALYRALKSKKSGRKWELLVGYTVNDLIKHLESKFDDKMSWDNYGSYWEVDHIKPRSLFNYICPEDKEFKECWELSNLQPLEAIENMKKGNKYEAKLLEIAKAKKEEDKK